MKKIFLWTSLFSRPAANRPTANVLLENILQKLDHLACNAIQGFGFIEERRNWKITACQMVGELA